MIINYNNINKIYNIEELIMRNELQFSFETWYSGHFDMQIYMGDKFLTSVDGDICMNENSLEWWTMERLKKFLQTKIDECIDILKIEMTKENVNEITYGDKLTALGTLNMAVATMRQIDPTFEFNLSNYFSVVINKNNKEHFSRSWAM